VTEVEISHLKGRWRVVIAGVDVTNDIVADGLRVELPSAPDYPLVHVTYRASKLDIKLDDAEVIQKADDR